MAATNAPKSAEARRRTNVPARGDWQAAPAPCWEGEQPAAPDGLMPASVTAWETWFSAWFSAFWKPEDLPQIRSMVRLYDQVERGEFQRHPELRLMMDTYGVTPKGRQDRRWAPPLEAEPAKPQRQRAKARLKAVK